MGSYFQTSGGSTLGGSGTERFRLCAAKAPMKAPQKPAA
jgi:hypothetical protein